MTPDNALVLVRTKLFLPTIGRGYVMCPRLIARLESGRQRKLTLISAPAGYGKTMLAASWLRQLDAAKIWLALDELDNDLMRPIAHLVAAFTNAASTVSCNACLRSCRPISTC